MKVFIILVTIILFTPSLLWASEVVLKSGQKVEGTVTLMGREIFVNTGVGTSVYYSLNDIDTIDGQNLTVFLNKENEKNNSKAPHLISIIITIFILFVLFRFCFSK